MPQQHMPKPNPTATHHFPRSLKPMPGEGTKSRLVYDAIMLLRRNNAAVSREQLVEMFRENTKVDISSILPGLRKFGIFIPPLTKKLRVMDASTDAKVEEMLKQTLRTPEEIAHELKVSAPQVRALNTARGIRSKQAAHLIAANLEINPERLEPLKQPYSEPEITGLFNRYFHLSRKMFVHVPAQQREAIERETRDAISLGLRRYTYDMMEPEPFFLLITRHVLRRHKIREP